MHAELLLCVAHQQGTHLHRGLQLHPVGFLQHKHHVEDWDNLRLFVTVEHPGQLLQAALDSVAQSLLQLLVHLQSATG